MNKLGIFVVPGPWMLKVISVDLPGNLSWNTHVNRISSTANRTVGFLKRNIKTTNQQVRECGYKALVRPQLEYASSVWDPHTNSNIDKLEAVQRRAARWTVSDYSTYSSVTEMLERLGWRSLAQRRSDARLCLFYKIVYGLVAIPMPDYIHSNNRVFRYCHSITYRQIHTGANYYKYSFFPLAIVQWNALPEEVVLSKDFNVFKQAVSTIYHTKP